jgi:hypothetical protein
VGGLRKYFISILFVITLLILFTPLDSPIEGNINSESSLIQNCIQEDHKNKDFLVVRNIQEFLYGENFYDGKINGYFDDNLLVSLKKFQEFVGIRIDGIMGPSTHKAMTAYNNCSRTVEVEFIQCSGYLAYKECTFFVKAIKKVEDTFLPISTTSTTTTTIFEPVCDDETFKPYTLYTESGNANTVMSCKNESDALEAGYTYYGNPVPPPESSSSSGSSTITISNLNETITINENQKAVVTISASGTGGLSYSLSGTDARLMSVDSDGVITLNSDADYDQKTSYSANAVVTDSVGSKTKAFTVSVADGSDKYVVDLLLVYHADILGDSTKNGYSSDYDTPSELLTFAQGQLETNQNKIFTDSEITNLEFNVVGIHSWDVTFADVTGSVPAKLQVDQTLHKAKVRQGADIIGAYIPGEGASSYLYYDTTKDRTNVFESYMLNYYYNNKYFPHELGHALGICHSREQSTNASSTGDCSKDYAHAYAVTSGQTFSTLVGYGGALCAIYSNPDLTCAGFPEVNDLGIPFHYQNDGTKGTQAAGVANVSDASRAIQEWAQEYERLGSNTNYGVSVGNTSIKSTAYFPLIDTGSASYSYTGTISNTSSSTKTMYVEKGSNVDVSGTTYETYYWCDTQNCDMNFVNPFNTGDDNHKFGILFYLNSGNYYIKTIGFESQRGSLSTSGSNNSLEVEFENPCLFISHYMKTGQYNEADCATRFENTWNYGTTYYDTWNFTNYVEKELVVTPYGAYDAYKIAHAQNSVGASSSTHRALQILNFWVNPEVGVVMFEDEFMRRWKLTGLDTDGDGTANASDTDDDGDGVLDTADAFPLDPNASSDTDSDGIADSDE